MDCVLKNTIAPMDDGAGNAVADRASAQPLGTAAPADPRTVTLTLVAIMLGLLLLRIAAAFFIPLLLSLALSYALSPAVRARCLEAERHRS